EGGRAEVPAQGWACIPITLNVNFISVHHLRVLFFTLIFAFLCGWLRVCWWVVVDGGGWKLV
ncbi:MAG: hypothetical protein ACO2PP_10750, partial [Thermocrinis sp.]|uniref:hypothetical protein n=1 Tax=Thermocrinis sp. TaxID=2024383 RepID=UPI003C07A50B